MDERRTSDFERAAAGPEREGLLWELWEFQRHNRKWWLLPLLVAFLLVSALGILGSTGAAPFIYTLF